MKLEKCFYNSFKGNFWQIKKRNEIEIGSEYRIRDTTRGPRNFDPQS